MPEFFVLHYFNILIFSTSSVVSKLHQERYQTFLNFQANQRNFVAKTVINVEILAFIVDGQKTNSLTTSRDDLNSSAVGHERSTKVTPLMDSSTSIINAMEIGDVYKPQFDTEYKGIHLDNSENSFLELQNTIDSTKISYVEQMEDANKPQSHKVSSDFIPKLGNMRDSSIDLAKIQQFPKTIVSFSTDTDNTDFKRIKDITSDNTAFSKNYGVNTIGFIENKKEKIMQNDFNEKFLTKETTNSKIDLSNLPEKFSDQQRRKIYETGLLIPSIR